MRGKRAAAATANGPLMQWPTQPSGPGFVTVYPCGASPPVASNLNYGTGQVVANLATAPTIIPIAGHRPVALATNGTQVFAAIFFQHFG